jgi:hypothetical protein
MNFRTLHLRSNSRMLDRFMRQCNHPCMTQRFAAAAFALALGAPSAASAMSFSFVPIPINNCTTNCPKVIVATGDMYFDDPATLVEKIKAGVQRDPSIRPVILLHSNGGNAAAGYMMGEVFRAIKATVIVARAESSGFGGTYTLKPGGCASACAIALMGGAKRIVPDGSKVGVHWFSAPTPQTFSGNVVAPDPNRRPEPDEAEARMRTYMRRMGVRPELAGFIRKVPNSSLHVMTAQEMQRFNLAQRTLR